MQVYALVGLGATAAHYLLLVILVEVAGFDAVAAAAIGALGGALAAYAGNRHFTFASSAPHERALPRFLAIAAAGAAMSAVLVSVGTHRLNLPYMVPQAVATVMVLVCGYALNQRWSFA
jgi:putative flippase GtrA